MASDGAEELTLFDLACAKVSQAQQLMSEARELLKRDLDNVKQEKSAFLELTKTLNEVHFGSKVKLNVGGKIYSTTVDTLRKDPDSMLCAMFSGRHELKPDPEDGAYFIDRDGKPFRFILNYLRDGDVHLPDDKMTRKELLKEAKFFQVQGIIGLLEDPTKLFDSSVILKNEHELSVINSWLGPGARCSLLFRASIHGSSAKDFHRCCDNKSATILVIKTGEYIYGGYTSKSWESPTNTTAKLDNEAFLFTLVNPSGSNPMKITPKPDAAAGIRCYHGFGPSYGTSTYYDLQIWNGSASNLDLGYGFTCPPNVDKKSYFTGKTPLTIDELEVFEVNF
ncbi:uncharacterized protein [Montipora foliosa]|uniref:uncharacterized protein isoform X2 n=1 Tax=Montipora foliosa TaxID=591990 RepID=UPI0035F1AA3C